MYSPKTTALQKGYHPTVLGLDSTGIPQIDVFSVLTYEYYNPLHNNKLTLRFGNFDSRLNMTLRIVIDTKEPNVCDKIRHQS